MSFNSQTRETAKRKKRAARGRWLRNKAHERSVQTAVWTSPKERPPARRATGPGDSTRTLTEGKLDGKDQREKNREDSMTIMKWNLNDKAQRLTLVRVRLNGLHPVHCSLLVAVQLEPIPEACRLSVGCDRTLEEAVSDFRLPPHTEERGIRTGCAQQRNQSCAYCCCRTG